MKNFFKMKLYTTVAKVLVWIIKRRVRKNPEQYRDSWLSLLK